MSGGKLPGGLASPASSAGGRGAEPSTGVAGRVASGRCEAMPRCTARCTATVVAGRATCRASLGPGRPERPAIGATEAAAGKAAAFKLLSDARNDFAQRWGYLKQGDPVTGLPPAPATLRPQMRAVQLDWERLLKNTDAILSSEQTVLSLHQVAATLDTALQHVASGRDALGVLRDGEVPSDPQPGLADLESLVAGVRQSGLPVEYDARDLGPDGIRCNLVSAGPLKTLAAKAIPGFEDLESIVRNDAMLYLQEQRDELDARTVTARPGPGAHP